MVLLLAITLVAYAVLFLCACAEPQRPAWPHHYGWSQPVIHWDDKPGPGRPVA